MNLRTKKSETYIFLIMVVGILLLGFSFTSPVTSNKGMPERVLSGEFGQRINQAKCMYEQPCYNYISASESSYILHGFSGDVQSLGWLQPGSFQFFIDGKEVALQRFSYQLYDDPHIIGSYFYHIFDAGTFSEGIYFTEGVWTAQKGNLYLYSFGYLVVEP